MCDLYTVLRKGLKETYTVRIRVRIHWIGQKKTYKISYTVEAPKCDQFGPIPMW